MLAEDDMAAGDPGWRKQRLEELLSFAGRARLDAGFGRLGRDGIPKSGTIELWINARMTYVFSDAAARGDRTCEEPARHGVDGLVSVFADPAYGGWFSEVRASGEPVRTAKSCYDHAFVLLAASAAYRCGIPGGEELFAHARDLHGQHFWSSTEGRCIDEWTRDWRQAPPYRGANANMHSVEAYLATADAGGDPIWLDRAADIAEFFVDQARQNSWRIPEHYDDHWRPDLDYNSDKVDDPFRPYGATPGHGLEWARLLLELEARLRARSPDRLLEASRALFDRAVADALSATPGLPYTTDWAGEPVISERFHWVIAEAVQAAEALWIRTGEQRCRDLADRWWGEIDRWFIEGDSGLWNHELGEDLRVSGRTWADAPDAYHAYNALSSGLDC